LPLHAPRYTRPHWGSTLHGLISENKHQNHWASFNRFIKTPLPHPPQFPPKLQLNKTKKQTIQTKHKTNSMTKATTKFKAKHKNIV